MADPSVRPRIFSLSRYILHLAGVNTNPLIDYITYTVDSQTGDASVTYKAVTPVGVVEAEYTIPSHTFTRILAGGQQYRMDEVGTAILTGGTLHVRIRFPDGTVENIL